MAAAVTLLALRGAGGNLFDGSVMGVSVAATGEANVLPQDGGVALAGGRVDVARHADLDRLDSFTIEAVVTPDSIGEVRQIIVEGETPPIKLSIEPDGQLKGAVHLASGWTSVDSGARHIQPGQAQRVTLMRDEQGQLELQLDGKRVGTAPAPGPLQPRGALGLRVGTAIAEEGVPFAGTIGQFDVRSGLVTEAHFSRLRKAAKRMQSDILAAGALKKVVVSLLPDDSHARLQQVKDIMHAAGVRTLSDLGTLPIDRTTRISPGQTLVGRRNRPLDTVNWSDLASTLRTTPVATQRELLGTHLANRNSDALLRQFAHALPDAPSGTLSVGGGGLSVVGLDAANPGAGAARAVDGLVQTQPSVVATGEGGLAAAGATSGTGLAGAGLAGVGVAGTGAATGPDLATSVAVRHFGDAITVVDGKLAKVDPGLISALGDDRPWIWPTPGEPQPRVLALNTVPLDSAVVIAGTLDLTNQKLVCEPNVGTLYIIADTVICGDQAAITWRRPGGSTPPRADEPNLNGRDFFGVQTRPDSRHGLDGGAGQPGQAGIGGAAGRHAPRIEMWVRNMIGLPNLDFSGEDGIAGGSGQRGGRGGRGGDGAGGERIWVFGWHCKSDPGDGGDGGDGARGGDGGRGGNGGHGGAITIGVLAGTLANTVAAKSFRIKNGGGRAGPGGAGGAGGFGGSGGRSGNGDTCRSAEDGHRGAQGQPGQMGPGGHADGIDRDVAFFEFAQDAWDDLMTRPWITALTPPEAFAGDMLTIHGSRFVPTDRVVIADMPLALTINADESASVTLPAGLGGGSHSLFVRRGDGTESNRMNIGIKPQLDPFSNLLTQSTEITLQGRSFLAGASILLDGTAVPGNVTGPTTIVFTTPGSGGAGAAGGTVSLQVRNPDGRVSNARQVTQPRLLEIPFRFEQHNLSFDNFNDGIPDFGTFTDTFGTAEILHELLDPVFGHPVLTAAYFAFYVHFLKGTDNGGLATGYCTSLASLVADRFWQGFTDTPSIQRADVHRMLTGQHGKLLSRETLLAFHDQGRAGASRVERTYRQIEATFLRGTDRQNAPLLFFIPSGAVWDAGYVDKLGQSHCVMPYRFAYPAGAAAPQLTPDLSSTISDPDGVELYVWDCNEPTSNLSRLRFRRNGADFAFEYLPAGGNVQFRSEDGLTLGCMRHGDYMLADHDLPFSGPFGLTAFVVDFLLSPADLEITNSAGMRTGNFGGQLLSEIPGSHPAYLMKGMYLLPSGAALNRTIVGNGNGSYDFHTIAPDGTSLSLEGVATRPGERDILSISGDSTQIRFTPAAEKGVTLTVARIVDGQARGIAVTGLAGGPSAAVDVTVAPGLNLVRLGNRSSARNVDVRAFSVAPGQGPIHRSANGISLPRDSDLAVTVTDWRAMDLQAQPVPF